MAANRSLKTNYHGVFDNRIGYGQKPAVLVVDFVKAYTTPGSALYAPKVIDAARATCDLLTLARDRGILVIYTRVIYSDHALDGGMFVKKIPVLQIMVKGEPLIEIISELAPRTLDVIIDKQYASAFFGTPLAALLTSQRIDTIILTGCTTSGCIRATAIDGIQHGFRVIVPEECVNDRHPGPHKANLFDINSKYGDVVRKTEVIAYLSSFPGGSTD